jgi:hypothetical protein
MAVDWVQRCVNNTSYAANKEIMVAGNPDFQFNRSLTYSLKLSETSCKPLSSLHSIWEGVVLAKAECAKMFVFLVMTLPPVLIILTWAFLHYTFDSSITHFKSI